MIRTSGWGRNEVRSDGAKDRDSGRNGSGRLRACVSNGEGGGKHPQRLTRAGSRARDRKTVARAHWRHRADRRTGQSFCRGRVRCRGVDGSLLRRGGAAQAIEERLEAGNDEKAKQVAYELVGKIPGARPLNGGKLENSRIVESLTALLIGLNMRYKVHGAGIRFTGLPVK